MSENVQKQEKDIAELIDDVVSNLRVYADKIENVNSVYKKTRETRQITVAIKLISDAFTKCDITNLSITTIGALNDALLNTIDKPWEKG